MERYSCYEKNGEISNNKKNLPFLLQRNTKKLLTKLKIKIMLDETKKEIKVALYLRVSTDEQAKEGHYSLEIQEESIRQSCKLRGYTINENHIYKDDISGFLPVEKRPELKKLFENMEKREFSMVVVNKTDRLARNLRNLLNIIHDLESNNVAFYSITEQFDTSTYQGKLLLHQFGAFAELEREMIRERTLGGRIKAARDGKWVMGLPPFGYKRNKATGKLEIIPVEARAVKKFFKWIVDEKLSLREVQRRANNLKLPAPKHRIYKKKHTLNYWHKRTINRILTNEVYTGTTYYRKYKRNASYIDKFTKKKDQRPVEEHIEMKVPQIITPELFQDALNQLLRNRDFAKRNQKRDYLFSKIIYCAECGFKMFCGYQPDRKDRKNQDRTDDSVGKYYHGVYRKIYEKGSTKRCSRCKQYAETRLEPVWDTLKEILKQPKIVFSLSEDYTTKQTDKVEVNNQLKQTEQELATIEKKRKRLTEVYVEDQDLTSDEYNKRKKELEIEKENLENERIKLNQFLLSKKEKQEREKSMKELYNTIKKQLDKFTYDEKVKIVRLFVNKITLFANKNVADVIYQFPNEYLIPVVNSKVDNLKDNCINTCPTNKLLENPLKEPKNKELAGCFTGSNTVLRDNHP